MDKVREQLIPIVCGCGVPPSEDSCDGCIWWKSHKCCNPKVDRILAIPELAVVERDAELPPRPEKIIWEQYHKDIYNRAQQDMIRAGWVKEVNYKEKKEV